MGIGISSPSVGSERPYGIGRNLYTTGEPAIDISKEVKNYKSRVLTGMSEDEWDDFYNRCKEYLDKHPIASAGDQKAFENFAKKLLKQYGFKGDMDEVIAGLGSGSDEASAKSTETEGSNRAETQGTQSQVEFVDEPDGTRCMRITTSFGQTIKVKISDGGEETPKPSQQDHRLAQVAKRLRYNKITK